MAVGIDLGGLILVLGAFSLVSIAVILLAKWSGVFDALSMLNQWLQTAIHWVGRVTSWAPRIVQIGLFVLVAGAMVVMLSDIFVTPTHVCSEGNVYSGNFFNVMTAKLLASDRSAAGQLAERTEQRPGVIAKFTSWVKSIVVSGDPAADFEKSKNADLRWGTFSETWNRIKTFRRTEGVTGGVNVPDEAFLDNTLLFFLPLENNTDASTFISMQHAFGLTDCRKSYNPFSSSGVCNTDPKYGENGVQPPTGGFDTRDYALEVSIVKYSGGDYADRCILEARHGTGFSYWVTDFIIWAIGAKKTIMDLEYSYSTRLDTTVGLQSTFSVSKATTNGVYSLAAECAPSSLSNGSSSCGLDAWYVQTGTVLNSKTGESLPEQKGCVVGQYWGVRSLGGTEEQVVNGQTTTRSGLSSRQQFIDTLREGDKESFVLLRDQTAVKFSCDAKDEVFFSVFGVNPFTPTFLYGFMGVLGFFWLLRLFGLI
jgi:hypothetical protein